MSLKAKIEAVIYAAEEPVTLAQLAGLFGEEAQLELDRRDRAQHTLDLHPHPSASEPAPGDGLANDLDPDGLDPEALNAETLGTEDLPELESEAETETETEAELEPDRDQPGSPAIDPLTPEPTTPSQPEIVLPAHGPAPSEQNALAEGGTESPPTTPDARQLARETRAREARLRDLFRELLDALVRDYSTSDRGLEIREVAGGYRLATKPEYHDAVRGFVKSLKPPLKLSLQALETLAVVAYKQPVTAPEVSEIRGVDSGGVLGSLMTRKLITTAGRKQVIGRPILYKTTKDFLLRFGLRDINELPSIEEFEKMAGELNDHGPVQEQIPMQDSTRQTPGQTSDQTSADAITGANLEAERDSIEPQADGDPTALDNATADDIGIDGRLSGLPPAENSDPEANPDVDSPALDAEVQRDASSGS